MNKNLKMCFNICFNYNRQLRTQNWKPCHFKEFETCHFAFGPRGLSDDGSSMPRPSNHWL